MYPSKFHPVIHFILRLFRSTIDLFASWIFSFFYESQSKLPPIPENDYEILTLPVVDLASKIQNGYLTSRIVVQAYVNRAIAVQPYINAFVNTRFEDALKEADDVDRLIQNTAFNEKSQLFDRKPFLGIPFTTKDALAVKGLKQTIGLISRRDHVSTEDSTAVANLKAAGGIILGVTNVPELCMWMETYNKLYGRTNNPYHLGRIPGGSSGGEAAAISSASSPFGIGSDIGGSIRMPSFFCGIYGHKCSTGEPVSNSGQIPVAVGIKNTFLSTGPMTRYAKDLLPAFKALISNEEICVNRLRLSDPVNVKDLKIYYIENDSDSCPLISRVHKDLQKCQEQLLKNLETKLKLTVERICIEEFYWSFNIWSQKMNSESKSPSFALEMNNLRDPPVNPFNEIFKWFLNSSNHTLPSIGLAFMENHIGPHNTHHRDFLDMCESLRHKLGDILRDDGVLIFPSHPVPAPYHGEALLKSFNFAYTAIFNVLGNPVTQIPLGISPETKTPVGVQLVGGLNQDRLTIALAVEIERMNGVSCSGGGWRTVF
ncbi:fatty-acid amide hydrolase 2-A [Lepeophtheirus salmonis]|uniref:Amidase domain-containing protein n=1 Tax=Lepeophtheirus salmonis TaxID=72036 RepID=A0A0K2U111_LEPSM|nr:fatty-acid amide hydrolase 2-A-like [Lepeophtheirus salmonis]